MYQKTTTGSNKKTSMSKALIQHLALKDNLLLVLKAALTQMPPKTCLPMYLKLGKILGKPPRHFMPKQEIKRLGFRILTSRRLLEEEVLVKFSLLRKREPKMCTQ